MERAGSGQADLYRAVAAALASDDPQAAMPVDPWDAVHTLAVIDAARVSAAQERVVTVRDPRPPLTVRGVAVGSGGGEAAGLEALLAHAALARGVAGDEVGAPCRRPR